MIFDVLKYEWPRLMYSLLRELYRSQAGHGQARSYICRQVSNLYSLCCLVYTSFCRNRYFSSRLLISKFITPDTKLWNVVGNSNTHNSALEHQQNACSLTFIHVSCVVSKCVANVHLPPLWELLHNITVLETVSLANLYLNKRVQTILTYLCTELSPSWEAAKCAVVQELPSKF
jgi:hypothetical protein